MAFNPTFADDEQVLKAFQLFLRKEYPFHILLTNHAIYWSGEKRLAVLDSVTTERLALHEIKSVKIGKGAGADAVVSGLVAILFGVAVIAAQLLLFYEPTIKKEVGIRPLFYGIMFTVGGVTAVVTASRRRYVSITPHPHLHRRALRILTPLFHKRGVPKQIELISFALVAWARDHGIFYRGQETLSGNPPPR